MVRQGIHPHNAGRLLGVAPSTVTKWSAELKYEAAEARGVLAEDDVEFGDVIPFERLGPEAQRAFEDFGFFRQRYFGRRSVPWAVRAAEELVELLATDEKEFVCLNAPPGVGKSTLFTHDIPAWLVTRDRSVRCLIGSRTERQAAQYTGRLRASFERTNPVPDADSTLTLDFGRFKPLASELWRREEFVVAQPGDTAVEDKEPTISAYGMDSGFLGGRYDFVIWDDLVDKKTIRSPEAAELLVHLYETEMESRVEPGGCLVLQGQRLAAHDLYRHVLDMRGEDGEGPKYRHILFPAHDENRCVGLHAASDPPWPEGCLLDPMRVGWRELATVQANRMERFRVVYQQEDVDPAAQLVQQLWIDGGRDAGGVELPGCWDADRAIGQLPPGVDLGECLSVATVDPSPTKYWAVIWWLYHRASERRFLIDIERRQMSSSEFLSFDPDTRTFSGLMVDWQTRSDKVNAKISAWVIEQNAAQRFMLQQHAMKLFQIQAGFDVIPHTTHSNKADPHLGVAEIGEHYRHGRVRFPAKGGISSVKAMIGELTRWPEGRTDDCVMAHWFLEWTLPRLRPPQAKAPRFARPTWVKNRSRALV